jgi:uncharacterized protein YukE
MGADGGFQANHEELQRLANTLRSSTRTLDEAIQAPPGGADVGRSTPDVQNMISQFTKATAGLRGGMEEIANNVADSGKTYQQNEQASSDDLSKNNGQTGGH